MILLTLLPLLITAYYADEKPRDAILLRDVQTLTLYRDRLTTGRRSAPLNQLTCVGGSGKHRSREVEIVQCYNQGFDSKSYQWKCDTKIDKSLKLGRIEVSCEGYNYPGDPYVLVGSCGLEYVLEETVLPKPVTTTTTTTSTTHSVTRHYNEYSTGMAYVIGSLLILFIAITVLKTIASLVPSRPSTVHPSFWTEPTNLTPSAPVEQPRRRRETPSVSTTMVNPTVNVVHHHYPQPVSTIIIDRPVSTPYHSSWSPTPVIPLCTTTTTTTTTTGDDPEPASHVSTSFGGTKTR